MADGNHIQVLCKNSMFLSSRLSLQPFQLTNKAQFIMWLICTLAGGRLNSISFLLLHNSTTQTWQVKNNMFLLFIYVFFDKGLFIM